MSKHMDDIEAAFQIIISHIKSKSFTQMELHFIEKMSSEIHKATLNVIEKIHKEDEDDF